MIDKDSDNERDPTYDPLGSTTLTTTTRVTRGTPRKVTPVMVTAYQSDGKHTLIGLPSEDASSSEYGSTSISEFASILGSTQSSGSKEITASGSNSQRATRLEYQDHQTSSDEATSLESTAAPRSDDPTPVVDEPN